MSKKKLTQIQAEALFDDLRAGFLNIEVLLRKIIETQAWIPLGYDTFTQAWHDKMRGVRLAQRSTAAVVAFAMLQDGATVEEVIEETQGEVSVRIAKAMEARREQGLPLDVAVLAPLDMEPTTPRDRHVVRPHTRKNPSPSYWLHLQFDPDYLADLKEFCEERKVAMEQTAADAVQARFRRMGFTR